MASRSPTDGGMTGRRPHRGVLKIARAALGTLLAGVALPVMLLFGLLLIPLGDLLSGRRRLGYEIGRSIMGVCWLLLGIRIEEVHRERIEPFRTRVYMPNHESLLDMPAVLSLLPGANGTLIKAEAYRVPLVGQAFRAVGFTPVDRKSPVSARRSLLEAVREVRRGRSFVIAPEGTRSRSGKLGSFKSGGFRIAMVAGVPIVPVTVRGFREIMPPGSRLVWPGVVRIAYGRPVETKDLDPQDRAQLTGLMRSVRQTMKEAAVR